MKNLRLMDVAEPDLSDAGEASDGSLDPSLFAGAWRNTNPETHSIRELRLDIRGSSLAVSARLAGSEVDLEWGTPSQTSVYTDAVVSRSPIAFSTVHEFNGYTAILQGNLNLGLLVLATYKAYEDSAKPIGYFSREFFAHVDADAPPASRGGQDRVSTGLDLLFGLAPGSNEIDRASVLGRWKNANGETRGIREIRFWEEGRLLLAQVTSIGPEGSVDWGTVPVDEYACLDEFGGKSMSLLVSYDVGFMKTWLQLRIPNGVLALASLTVFQDGSSRSNYFTREFFYLAA